MSSDPSTQETGRAIRIGKYEVLAHIASGGMGAVYRAFDTENHREVALKVMTPEMASKPAMLERFRREARSGLKLQHENIVTLYEFSEANGTCYLAMEFVEGIDLHEYIDQKGTLDPEESRQIVIQAARALNHAHKQGIVHRDIKPSNFLITQRNGQLRVKMTDLGLAREASNEEFRVTRSGTTVGTVDYISPEQARDSGLADIRSDLYSLGCSWYHMLAGQTPFAEGGLAERLLKHMTAEPPDVRSFNPRASDELVRVLGKLLAKKPDDRYQNPQELIQDLVSIDPIAKPPPPVKKAPANGEPEGPKSKVARRSGSGARRGLSSSKRKSSRSRDLTQGNRIWVITGLAAIALVAVLVLWLGSRSKNKQQVESSDLPRESSPRRADPAGTVASVGTPEHVTGRSVDTPSVPAPASPKFRPLYKPELPVDVAQTRAEYQKPWANQFVVPGDATVLQVSRVPGKDGKPTFPSLAAAFRAALPGKTTIIEIDDNGPLFEVPASSSDRNLVLRAGPGFRPLLVWDVQRTVDERKKAGTRLLDGQALFFLEVQRGSLRLEGLDLVLQWPDRQGGRGALLQVTDGDLTATGCTFSLAGRAPDGVAVARVTGSKAESGRCRMSRCFGRGTALVVLEMEMPGGEALLENCLFVSGASALINVRAGSARPTTVRTLRSTLVCGQSLLALQGAGTEVRAPFFNWMGWDSLFARWSRHGDQDMIVARDNISTQNVHWQAIGCLYTGWKTLLTEGADVISTNQFRKWCVHWQRTEGDVAMPEPWPESVPGDLAEISPAPFRPLGSPVAYASTADPKQPLGCDFNLLPIVRESWVTLTYERFILPVPEAVGDGGSPEIPRSSSANELYQGEALDLNAVEDLGKHLQRLKDSKQFAPRVVLRLSGTGQKKTSPFVVPRGTSLTLHVKDGESPDLGLIADASPGQALFETEDGSLDISGVQLRLPDQSGKGLTYLLKVQGGDLHLQRCQLLGPLAEKATGFESLIHFQGSGFTSADKARNLVLERCTLVSSRDALQVQGLGARVLMSQSLVVSGESAFHFDFGKGYQGRANAQCSLTRSTIAARYAVVQVGDVQDVPVALEPLIVQTSRCAFMNPFPGAKCGMLAYDGAALVHGLVLWQGEDDGFHSKLHFWAVQAGAAIDKARQEHSLWAALWGSPGDRGAQINLNLANIGFDTNNPRWDLHLDRLTFQSSRIKCGAELDRLGLKKRIR